VRDRCRIRHATLTAARTSCNSSANSLSVCSRRLCRDVRQQPLAPGDPERVRSISVRRWATKIAARWAAVRWFAACRSTASGPRSNFLGERAAGHAGGVAKVDPRPCGG
jgi:hypothetical protein